MLWFSGDLCCEMLWLLSDMYEFMHPLGALFPVPDYSDTACVKHQIQWLDFLFERYVISGTQPVSLNWLRSF